MTTKSGNGGEDQLATALGHLQSALALLDAVGAPPFLGAKLDDVIHQLSNFMRDDKA